MIKYKTFSKYTSDSTDAIESYNKEIKDFITEIDMQGHTFISINTIAHGSNLNRLRTEIIYRDNETRKVIMEKTSS
jgi:hypothetical protein